MRAGIGPWELAGERTDERLPRASGDRPVLGVTDVLTNLVAPCERG